MIDLFAQTIPAIPKDWTQIVGTWGIGVLVAMLTIGTVAYYIFTVHIPHKKKLLEIQIDREKADTKLRAAMAESVPPMRDDLKEQNKALEFLIEANVEHGDKLEHIDRKLSDHIKICQMKSDSVKPPSDPFGR